LGPVFPAEIKGVDMDQFIGGELSFEEWLAEFRGAANRGCCTR
jgi:hypothetical protein